MHTLLLVLLLHHAQITVITGKHRKIFSGSVPVNAPLSSPVIFVPGQPVIFVPGQPTLFQ